ncbi:hypothetical protein BH18ACT12_BH18ACT12_11840 [soil metagenome]
MDFLVDVSEITPHTLRRTFATTLRRDETSLDTISKLLGHSSTKVTEDSYVELEAEVIARELFGTKATGRKWRGLVARSAA